MRMCRHRAHATINQGNFDRKFHNDRHGWLDACHNFELASKLLIIIFYFF